MVYFVGVFSVESIQMLYALTDGACRSFTLWNKNRKETYYGFFRKSDEKSEGGE